MHDDCKRRFLELKTKRTHRFIVFKIEEKQKQVIVEKVGEPNQNYEDFAASLPADECRYAVYDFDFVTAENCQKSRIFFIAWYNLHFVSTFLQPDCGSILLHLDFVISVLLSVLLLFPC